MNRREFIGGAAATGLAPLVPAPSLTAAAGAAAPAAVAGNFTPYMYAMGVHHARTMAECSTQLLADQLGVHVDVAQAINARLIKKGIISAPNALGLSRALNPVVSSAHVSSAKTWTMTDPVHAEYVERSRLNEALKQLAAEEDNRPSIDKAQSAEAAKPDGDGVQAVLEDEDATVLTDAEPDEVLPPRL